MKSILKEPGPTHIAVYTCVASWLPVSKHPNKLHVSPCNADNVST